MIENIHHAEFLGRSQVIQKLNVRAIDTVADLYRRGIAQGVFREGLDPVELHWQISALCFFNVSNRATFSKIFRRDLGSKKSLATGLPMAAVLLPAAVAATVTLPVVVFHQFQLTVCAAIARRLAESSPGRGGPVSG